jgi:hypothetical protein
MIRMKKMFPVHKYHPFMHGALMGVSSICHSIYNMFHPFILERMLWHSTSFKGNMTSNEKAPTCIMLSQWGRILASKHGGGPNF